MNEIIQRYQQNFNELPEIDVKESTNFLTNALQIKQALPTIFIEKHKDSIKKINLDTKLSKDSIHILIQNILNEIHIFTNQDLYNSIQKGIQWISDMFQLNGTYQRWALLTENLYKNNGTFKSPEWIGAFAWRLMDIKDPKGNSLLPYCVSDIDRHSIISKLYNDGIEYFIMFDDGAYSGVQKSTAIFMNAWNQLTKHTSKQSFTIIIVIPFLTRKAIEKFRMTAILNNLGFDTETVNNQHNYCHWTDSKTNRNVFIWGGTFVMENTTDIVYKNIYELIPNNLNLCKQIYDFMIQKVILDDLEGVEVGAALCMFEHKIPDYLSFPVVIADEFYKNNFMKDHYNENPPYKNLDKHKRTSMYKQFNCSS